ncbi:MAG: cystathionine gamma-synthase family protein [Deltaproteobacteria bacterium]|nr:cystathionine gamma-synthase family protein [Deltaproteobacteria bacterium]
MSMKRSHASGHPFNPETLALGYGYDPLLSEGSVKPPVFLTSTFQFESAEEGKRFFELAYGLRQADEGETSGLIYSRLNNPNLQIFEERMAAWDEADTGATFASGMAAIATTLLAMLRPGDVLLRTSPVYGGTYYLCEHILPSFGIKVHEVPAGSKAPEAMRALAAEVGWEHIRGIYVETPSNPDIVHTDIAAMKALALEIAASNGAEVPLMVDNTFLGPLFQRPVAHGADLVLYSATKFIGGHSDLIAGVVTGRKAMMLKVLEMRTILGTMTTPFNGWLLQRSLETLSVRMRRQAKSARKLAELLKAHPKVLQVTYPGMTDEGDEQHAIWERQCTGTGSLISFEVEGGEAAAFRVLNHFEIARLAVSLGGTESLVEHPMTMTHSDMPQAYLERLGVRPGLIRMSVGLEHLSDLERDLEQALSFA